MAGQAELQREQVATAVGRSRQFFEEWIGRFRRGGVDLLRPRKQPRPTPKLLSGQQEELSRSDIERRPGSLREAGGLQRADPAGVDQRVVR
ncbi:helix-turn-helix domain-containing protein [Humisphaera borealis]|uniref:Helix-turn-helix domain-containing protein n=1 Tax=Humisphaera borealis TaxID=2807512 RepID=A0A7M2X1Q8_9BACT|nr:helix-turn-helix domain-containing protein [Humisphaera borealis]